MLRSFRFFEAILEIRVVKKGYILVGQAGLGIGLFMAAIVYFNNQASESLGAAYDNETQMIRQLANLENSFAKVQAGFDLAQRDSQDRTSGYALAQRQASEFDSIVEDIINKVPLARGVARDLLAEFNIYLRNNEELLSNLNKSVLTDEEIRTRKKAITILIQSIENKQFELSGELNRLLDERIQAIAATEIDGLWLACILITIYFIFIVFFLLFMTSNFDVDLTYTFETAEKMAEGDWDLTITPPTMNEVGEILLAIDRIRGVFKRNAEKDARTERAQTRFAELNEAMRGDQDIHELGENIINYLVPSLGAHMGAIYLTSDISSIEQSTDDAKFTEEKGQLIMAASYAFNRRKGISDRFNIGEGLLGQAALEKKQIDLSPAPEGYAAITSALGEKLPASIMVTPIIHENELKGMIELASLDEFDDDARTFLKRAMENIGIAFNTAESRFKLALMLKKTQEQQRQMELQQRELQKSNDDLEAQTLALRESQATLQAQQEELRVTNEELEAQTQALKASEESLQTQQEELRVANEELVAQAEQLAKQKEEMARKNETLKRSQQVLAEKAEELERSSQYKSEFLSTMSHELRTPLNSILILSNTLIDNKQGNLSDKQVEHAKVIHSAGSDLLTLINDILDLSKVNEGKMQLVVEKWPVVELAERFRLNFQHVAQEKGLDYQVTVGEGLGEFINTDRQRLEQVIKNFLSNAFKFTDNGGVYVNIKKPADDLKFVNEELEKIREHLVIFEVADTGIGIPEEKQAIIWEAFQQADGTTSRKYGGTGLGLTISRELARLLGGEVQLTSKGDGQGTSFYIIIPDNLELTEGESEHEGDQMIRPTVSLQAMAERLSTLGGHDEPPPPADTSNGAGDAGAETFDFAQLPDKSTVLIIEDDEKFAQILKEMASEYGLVGTTVSSGEEGIEYAKQHRPGAIILDIGLPGIDGWKVMEELQANPLTESIPVHFLSGKEGQKEKAMEMGAMDFLAKPAAPDQLNNALEKISELVAKAVRKLLVVEDNPTTHDAIQELFETKGIEVVSAQTGEEALIKLSEDKFDCVILDLELPDMNGHQLLKKMHATDKDHKTPVIIYTAKDLMREEEAKLRKYADRIILKTERSSERLLNEVSLFLHWIESKLTKKGTEKKRLNEAVDHRDDALRGKNILVVDDDMRNIYSITSVLEDEGIDVIVAQDGIEALNTLSDEGDNIDLVLMDIMMPEMDGYEAMGKIRKQDKFKTLPIIALTAKAMRDDRAKCIEAGANDYISKPLDTERLLSLIRVWLQK